MPPRFDDLARRRLAAAIRGARADGDAADGESAWEAALRRADDIAEKMELIGTRIVCRDEDPAIPGECDVKFTSSELDCLSRHEHGRWMREKLEEGWTLGPAVDPVARTHPCLVGYDQLPEVEKEKDREQVRRIPALLHAAGLRAVRRVVRP
jgi:hypothetical protein